MALRRLIHAVALHSRQLAQNYGLTSPQALILKEAVADEPLSAGQLAKRVSLSQATVTDILNRLEKRGLITRVRSTQDKRRVLIEATPEGRKLMWSSPPLLQERFAGRFVGLQDWEQNMLLAALQRIAALMDVENVDVGPISLSDVIDSSAATSDLTEPQAQSPDS